MTHSDIVRSGGSQSSRLVITNEGGVWVDKLMETAGAQGTPPPQAFDSLTSVIIDDNDKVHVGLGDVGYGTTAY